MSQLKTATAISVILLAAMLAGGCQPFVSEFADSSGCMFTKGGPNGITFGEVVVCRSGKDKATVMYQDSERAIAIEHAGESVK